MRLRSMVVALIAILVAAGTWSSGAAPRKVVAVTEELVGLHQQFLASDATRGRRTGDKGLDVAAKYIADQFRRIGLKPVGTSRMHDLGAAMDGSGFYQPWAFPAGSARGKANALEATIGGKRVRYRVGADYEPSVLTGVGKASGEVVFAGLGYQNASRDDYAGIEAKGKIALVLSEPPSDTTRRRSANFDLMRKVQTARDRGAVALIVALPADNDKPQINADSRPSDSGIPVLMVRRSVASAWIKAAGKSLADLEKAQGDQPQSFATGVQAEVAAEVVKVTRPAPNVIGMLPGSDPELKKEYVVIGAHYDHLGQGGQGSLNAGGKPTIHYGADDNASGTAGVIALAEHLSSLPDAPKRSILFMAFAGEEQGLLGSAHYAKNAIKPIDQTVAMLNLDMIGRMRDNKLSVIGVGTSPAWNPMLDELNRSASFQMTRSSGGYGGSDHQSFYAAKVPVLFFFTGTHPDYHKPTDTFDKINLYDQMRVVNLVAACAVRLTGSGPRPEYSDAGARTRPTTAQRLTIRASLGIMPEYAAETVGVPVGSVRAGTPAEQAGLKAGDVIVKVADKTVRNIEEYMAAFSGRNVGEVVAVTVKRDGKELTFQIKLVESRR